MADLGILQVKVVPDMGDFASQVSGAMGKVGSAMARISGQVARDVGNIGASLVTAGSIGIGFMAVTGIKMAASLETAQLQFQTLLGSADAAKAKVAELFDFAKRTPFESGPVIEASRRLQVFGGAALNTEENLQRIGDAAAATSAPIEEVAFWVGRAYSQIKGGQPFGEAAMRLQELGILTPEVRTEMENLAKAGASSADVFGKLQTQLDGFSGAMELQAATLTGLTSTIKDQFGIGMATAFQPVFESIKNLLSVVRDFGDSPAFKAITDNMAHIAQIVMDVLQPAIDFVGESLKSLSTADVDSTFRSIEGFMLDVADGALRAYDAFQPLVPVLAGVAGAFLSVRASGIPLIGLLFPQITGLTGALLGFTLGVEGNRDALAELGRTIAGAAEEALPKMQGSIKTISDSLNVAFRGALDAIAPALETLVTDTLPVLADVLAQVAPPLAEVVVELAKLAAGVIQSVAPTLAAIAQAVGAILSAGLSVLADTLGFVNDHLAVMGPLLAGVALAFAAFKLTSFITNMGMVKTLLDNIKLGVATTPSTTFFGKIAGGAEGAMTAVGGLSSLLLSGGVALGFAAIANAIQGAARRAAEAKGRIEELATAIDSFGDTTKTANEFIEDLRDNSDFTMAIDTAESVTGMDDLTAAIRGSKEDLDAYIDANKTELVKALDGNVGMFDVLTKRLGEANSEYADGKTKTDEMAASQEGQAQAQEDAAQKTQGHIQALQGLRDAMDDVLNKTLSVNEADIRRRDSLAGLAQAIADSGAALDANTGKFDLNTEAGRRGSEILQGLVRDTQGYIQAVIDAGGSQEELTWKTQGAYNALVSQLAVAFGISEEAAAGLVQEMGLVPENIQSQVDVETQAALEKTADIKERLKNVDDTEAVADINALLQDGKLTEAENRLNEVERTYEPVIKPVIHLDSNFLANEQRMGNVARSSVDIGGGVEGEPLMPMPFGGPEAGLRAGGGDGVYTVHLRPRTLSPRLHDGLAQQAATIIAPQVETKVFLGTTQITDMIRQEERVVARDRSMAYLTVPT